VAPLITWSTEASRRPSNDKSLDDKLPAMIGWVNASTATVKIDRRTGILRIGFQILTRVICIVEY